MPATLAPQLASLASAAPTSGAWSWEIKLDGYRLMARIEDGKVRLITRGGHDWSAKMPALVKALQSLKLKSAWLDGEIVVLGKNGTPDFNALQNAFDRSRTDAIDYFLFDLPYFEGHDLRATPLVQRRQLLKQLLDEHPHEHLRFSADFDADAASILESARRMGLEGVIAKRKDAPYESRRTETWLKLKNKLRQEFVVAGYTDRSSGEAQIGSLLLAVHDDGGQLVYVGNVGTGWNAKTAAELKTAAEEDRGRHVAVRQRSRCTSTAGRCATRRRSTSSSRRWSPKSSSRTGRPTARCGMPSTWACASTRRRRP